MTEERTFGPWDEESFQLEIDLLMKPRRWAPLFPRTTDIACLDLAKVHFSPKLPLHRKCLITFLELAMRDRATELFFDPWVFDVEQCRSAGWVEREGPGIRLFCKVKGEFLEYEPLPLWLSSLLIQDLETLVGLRRARHRLASRIRRLADRLDGQARAPISAQVRLLLDHESFDIALTAYHSALGWRFLWELPICSETSVQQLDVCLKTRVADWFDEGPAEPLDG